MDQRRAIGGTALRACTLAVLLAGPAAAQGFGPPPTPYQPGPFPQSPGMPGGMPNAGPSLVGAWSGQRPDANGPIQQTDAFSPDGKFVSVGRLPNGLLARTWGYYRATPAGQNQLRVDFQVQGWLPQQVCRQAPGYALQCQPFQIPTTDTVLVTFYSPDQFQSVSQTMPGQPIVEMRDGQAALLQVQAPQRWVINVPPPQAPMGPVTSGPVVTPYTNPIRRGPATNIPGLGGNCDDLQQRRICSLNGGTLVPSGGCLTCVN